MKSNENLSCENHYAGTMGSGIGKFYLGMPRGFNRIGECKDMILNVYEDYKDKESYWEYDKFNIPAWKYRNEERHVFVRGLSPRINAPFIHVILKCTDEEFNKIDCLEIKEEDREDMD